LHGGTSRVNVWGDDSTATTDHRAILVASLRSVSSPSSLLRLLLFLSVTLLAVGAVTSGGDNGRPKQEVKAALSAYFDTYLAVHPARPTVRPQARPAVHTISRRGPRSPPLHKIARHKFFRDLERVEGRGLTQVVAHEPEGDTCLAHRGLRANTAHVRFIAAG